MKRVATWVDELAAQHALSPRMVIVILIAPLLLAFVTALALLVPATQAAARWVTGGEDRPVEVATVVALLLAGLLAVRRVLRAAKAREPRFVQLFFALFAVVMVFVALEEISWGQHLLGLETPDAFKHNAQQELTLHSGGSQKAVANLFPPRV